MFHVIRNFGEIEELSGPLLSDTSFSLNSAHPQSCCWIAWRIDAFSGRFRKAIDRLIPLSG